MLRRYGKLLSYIRNLLSGFKKGSVEDLFRWVFDSGSVAEFELFVLICWSVWMARNVQVFQGKKQSWFDVIDRAARVKELSFLHNAPVSHAAQHVERFSHWHKPSSVVIKFNVDASVFVHLDFYGVGMVGRDSSRVVVCVECKVFQGIFSPLLAELVAIKSEILCAIEMGWDKIIIESDDLKAVNVIDNFSPCSMEAPVFDFILNLISIMEHVPIKHCYRSANSVTHEVALRSICSRQNFAFVSSIL